MTGHLDRRQSYFDDGFTYMALMVAVIVIGLAVASTGKVWSTVVKRDREAELLFRGVEIKRAIGSYYRLSPGVSVFPKSLDDLVKDPRQPSIVRHLRKLYTDPMTGKADWVLIKDKGGGVLGVRSSSEARPLKKGGFPAALSGLEGKGSYSEWRFVFEPKKDGEPKKAAKDTKEGSLKGGSK